MNQIRESIEKVEAAVKSLQSGEFVVLMDAASRENEGDLVMAAEKMTPEKVNFMITHARGLVCISLSDDELKRLELPQMVTNNQDMRKTKFTVSVDAVEATTGISAGERSETIRRLVDPKFGPQDFVRPGHVFPIATHPDGLVGRRGHTEASFELVSLAGLTPGATFCELINSDGTMAREKDLATFAEKHQLVFLKIADIVNYKGASL